MSKGSENETTIPDCVICVGSTGSGKSATIANYTRLPIESNAGARRVTEKCSIYRRPGAKWAWIDTVGWDDKQLEDEETFKTILKFIDDNYLTKIKAVIWTVHPNVRSSQGLSSQAKLIDKFAPKEIWDKVVIIVKQSMVPNEDGRGALAAALEYNVNANVQILGYRFITDETLTRQQQMKMQEDENLREAFNVWTDDDVRDALQLAVENTGDPVQVVFRSKKCLDCSQRGDERLLGQFCHMQPTFIHTGISELCHPGWTEPYHRSSQVEWKHRGRLHRLPQVLGGSRWSCCYKKTGGKGCIGKFPCCGIGPSGIGCRTRYTCCKKDISNVDDVQGCQERFACCRGRTRDPGCTQVRVWRQLETIYFTSFFLFRFVKSVINCGARLQILATLKNIM